MPQEGHRRLPALRHHLHAFTSARRNGARIRASSVITDEPATPLPQAVAPSPFYFFDEVDCALDTSNAARVAAYLQRQAAAQYIVVSHKPQVGQWLIRPCRPD